MSICPKCKERERNGKQPYCKECASQYAKAYYAKNREAILAKNKIYLENLSGEALVRRKTLQAEYADRIMADPELREARKVYMRAWWKAHPEKRKEYDQRQSEKRREWRRRNKEFLKKQADDIKVMKQALTMAVKAM